ncbi:MAG: DEAD/DEAH box helicase, partial [Proteobacteria bacterium]|nr:DEAD/DEAH box helicase [Pseudomonadota bacterium]
MPPLESEARIRAALSCTWHAFFARFPHLRDVQRAAIPPILKGESVLVQAPTASGKTEALMAPVLERFLKYRKHARKPLPANAQAAKGHKDVGTGPAILLVAPTKALCNDLYRRLQQPVSNIGLELALRTGDNPNYKVANPPHIVITTPESLDSLISRKPASFLYLESIIIDEIHLIHANGRGDQLQCLLARLRILNKGRPLQVCASSATVPETERIASDFLGPESRTISCPAGTRDIRATIEMIPSDPKAALNVSASIIKKLLLES